LYFSEEDFKDKKKTSPYIEIAPHHICTGRPHLESFVQDIIDQRGEGVIIRDPNALYQLGRSTGFLKHKVCKKEKNMWRNTNLFICLLFSGLEMLKQGL